MEYKTIYTKITYNIEKRISQFREGKITSTALNEQLLINLSSLCRFLKNREKEKQNSGKQELNETILDVFVPFSRLSSILQKKLETLIAIDETQEYEKDLNLDECEFGPVLDDNEFKDNQKTKEFSSIIDNEDAIDSKEPNNNNYLMDDNQSVAMSLFNHPIEETGFDNKDPFKSNITMQKRGTISTALANENESRFSQISIKTERFTIDEDRKQDLTNARAEFKNILKQRTIDDTIKEMSIEYLRYMYDIYKKMKNSCDNSEQNEYKSLNFINQFKSFVLEIGISDKKFYEQCIREIIYNKNMFEFSEFLECFRKLLNLKFDQTFLKYKCKSLF